jgi:hypothetical protein
MSTDLESIKSTLVNISKGNDILDMLLEFERTLDNAELFAYKNWILGEIVDGPHISRYWFTLTLMYPAAMMPDPDAGLRLTKLGAKVGFRKGKFTKPVKVTGPADWANPETKRAKMAHHEVWLVTIELPIKYINHGLDQLDDVIQQDIETTNAELADAYEEEMPAEDTMQPPDQEMGGDMPQDMPPDEEMQ